jgi:hypothetical protein
LDLGFVQRINGLLGCLKGRFHRTSVLQGLWPWVMQQ